jgi:hypothetical protein
MRKFLMSTGAALLLASCASGSSTSPTIPPAISSVAKQVQTVCAQALPLAAAVPTIGVYATAFCGVDSLITNATPADLSWISNILGELKGNVAPAPAQTAGL